MIGVVIVSHSARLAEGVVELVQQVAQDKVRVAAAGGTADGGLGTDAFRVMEAIEAVKSDEGMLVLMDLGSAVLSAETALEMLDEDVRSRVRLCDAPLVEGAVAAVSLAAAGGTLEEIAAEAERSLSAKTESPATGPGDERVVTLSNPLGLHARPAARLIRLLRPFDARVAIENVTAAIGPVEAASLNGLLRLRARQGHQLRLRAEGEQASQILAELARFVESGCGDTDQPAAERPHTAEDQAIGASPGIAVGPLLRFHATPSETQPRTAGEPDAEWHLLESALAAARDETRRLYDWARLHAGENEAGIFDAQCLLLEDPDLIARARRLVSEDHRDAASAWQSAAGEFTQQMAALDDPYLSARAADLSDIASRVLTQIPGSSTATLSIARPSIVAAHDLLPSQVEKLDPALVLGVCLETGSASAHAAILARARGIPAVAGLGLTLSTIPEGTLVGVDGTRGKLWISPDPAEIRDLEEARRAWLASRQTTQAERRLPCSTRDGRRVTLLANLSSVADAIEALESGAEGVGVARTEFLFIDRQTAPTEEEQLTAYRAIADTLGERPLVIRTLDIGGDKRVPYIDIGAEPNPFLGWRGIRVTLGRRDLFETQLRAILRAGHQRPVEILLPMISTLEELREAKAVIRDVEAALLREGVPFRQGMPVGVMIEVPAAAVTADRLASEASRLSIGTNDLVQYLMAADRTNSRVAHAADYFQPAVLRLIRDVVEAGRRTGIRVDVCGEMAADPRAVPLLLGLGLEELSMSAPLIPEVKRTIARWTVAEAEALAGKALEAESSDQVRRLFDT
jgi:phosphoenolpyruvate-protein phosphotransferase/dihydroxyacetone kinase phosphotransfer subunit